MESVTSMRGLAEAVRAHQQSSTPAVLATLVRIVGPAFRPLGTRMLVDARGQRTGDLSGGCLDDDVAQRAVAMLDQPEARRLVYDGERIADLARGFATGCPRRVEILLQPLAPDTRTPFEQLERWRCERRTGVWMSFLPDADDDLPDPLAWELGETPSAPADRPELANELVRLARALEVEPHTRTEILRVGDESVEVLAEVHAPAFRLLCIGGSVALVDALRSLATGLGWEVVCISGGGPSHGPRPDGERVIPPDEIGDSLGLDPRTGALILTHHNARDREWILSLLRTRVGYVGVMGSRRRLRVLFESLAEDDLTAYDQGRIFGPVGLDLGGRDPAEMALSIAAEMQAVLNGRSATSLRRSLTTGETAAIVLAAGSSSRSPASKQLLPQGSRSLLRRAAEQALEAGCRPVVVVLGYEAERMAEELEGLRVGLCIHLDWHEGMGSSLAAGARHLLELDRRPDRVLVSLCDQPAVDGRLLSELLETHLRHGREMTASRYAGILGVPAVFEAEQLPTLAGLSGDRGARDLLRSANTGVTEFPFEAGALDLDGLGLEPPEEYGSERQD